MNNNNIDFNNWAPKVCRSLVKRHPKLVRMKESGNVLSDAIYTCLYAKTSDDITSDVAEKVLSLFTHWTRNLEDMDNYSRLEDSLFRAITRL
jgi:hypothetical protein